MSFQVTILGCSSATPTIDRNPTAQYLTIQDRHFLIDCGEGTQMQLRKFKIKFNKISHVFISHLHGDHYFGLMGFLSSLHLLGRTTEMHLHCPEALKEILELQFKHSDTRLRYPLIYHFTNTLNGELIFEDDVLTVETVVLNHRVPCTGFIFREKPKPLSVIKEKIAFYKIKPSEILKIKNGADFVTEDGQIIENKFLTHPPANLRSYAFCSDTTYLESVIEAVKNVDLLYHEATFMHNLKERATETYHSTCKEAGMIAQKANVKQLIIGHYSARYGDLNPLLQEAQQEFANTLLAKEGTVYSVE
jgi:ribonuclease Z